MDYTKSPFCLSEADLAWVEQTFASMSQEEKLNQVFMDMLWNEPPKKVLKFFPAEQSGGLEKIKAMSAPFPMFRVMPTGGITLGNLERYLSCPAVIACGGSYMAPGTLIERQSWNEIQALCTQTAEIVGRARK